MTQEEKQLLLKDLCARLPYGVIVQIQGRYDDGEEYIRETEFDSPMFGYLYDDEKTIIPYLRPMSSMTFKETREFLFVKNNGEGEYLLTIDKQDWLNKNHFDYRGLIPMGLALEATEEMYGKI